MKRPGRITVYLIAAVMAVTCFVPVGGVAFATEDGTDQTAQPTQDQTTQPATTAPTKAKKPADPFKGKKGWVKYKGKKYYIKKGKPLKGVKKIKGKWYEFSKKTGVFKRKIGDKMDKKAQEYKSSTKKLILVNKSWHKVRVYKGKKNKWKRMKNFTCTIGKSSTPTPSGTYRIGNKGRYFNTGVAGRCWYWSGFIGNIYLFHSVIYNRNSSPTQKIDGRLGISASHGCIRLALKNARWIYNYVPRGTKVVIY